MLGREGWTWKKIELHVALFLVLLSPGYNPPRRRRCLYLSRGKPPSVCAYLSFFPPVPHRPFPTLRLPDPPRYVHPVPPHSQSTFWQLTLVPSSALQPPSVRSLPPSLSLSPSLALFPPVLCPPSRASLVSLYHRSPRHTLFSLRPPSPVRFHPPKAPPPPRHPLTPSYPSLYSIPMLYRSRAPAPSQPPTSPLPSSGAPTHPIANHPLKVGAPYWRLNHPARGRVEDEGMDRGG